MNLKRHENLIFSVTSLVPCLISRQFPTSYSKIGILTHYPFRFAFNIHRAFFNDLKTSQQLYKLDILFFHICLFLIGFDWERKIQKLQTIFHILCIYSLKKNKPFYNGEDKHKIDTFLILSIFHSTFHMYYVSKLVYFSCFYICMVIACFNENPKQQRKLVNYINLLMGPMYYALFWSVDQIHNSPLKLNF